METSAETEVAFLKKELAEAFAAKAAAEERADEAEKELATVREQLAMSQCSEAKLKQEIASRSHSSSWLKCPSRSPKKEHQPCTQEICWQIVVNMQGVTALLCSIDDFTIIDASMDACKIWGSGALYGQSILSLLDGSSRASWFAKALAQNRTSSNNPRHKSVNHFAVKDLGCEQFARADAVFDSAVLVITLPEEPEVSRPAALLVIMEPKFMKKKEAKEVTGKRKEASKYRSRGSTVNCTKAEGPSGELVSSAKDMIEVLTDIVIHLTADLQVLPSLHAQDLARQEALFGWVLSGAPFSDVLEPVDYRRLTDLLVLASETGFPFEISAISFMNSFDPDFAIVPRFLIISSFDNPMPVSEIVSVLFFSSVSSLISCGTSGSATTDCPSYPL